MATGNTEDGAYTWETEYEKTWELLEEDAQGSLKASIDGIVHRAKRQRLLDRPNNTKLGMMRHVCLIIDMSQSMLDQDLKPNRLCSSLKLLESFVEEYFDQNPISQLGIICTKNKRAEKISELSGNPRRHISHLKQLKEQGCQGDASLQNALELAAQGLRNMPSYASREILLVFGSLTSCDPGEIADTISTLKNDNINCSIIGLCAEVRICRKVCEETRGTYSVIIDESHFKDLLLEHVSPPQVNNKVESSLIKMGFPHQLAADNSKSLVSKPALCLCHVKSKQTSDDVTASTGGYFCPQCSCKCCELPAECAACGLTLVSAPHLARSYHHLFPLAAFSPVSAADFTAATSASNTCFSCMKHLTENMTFKCDRCCHRFCSDCDIFIHETVHSCPGCSSSREGHVQLRQTSD